MFTRLRDNNWKPHRETGERDGTNEREEEPERREEREREKDRGSRGERDGKRKKIICLRVYFIISIQRRTLSEKNSGEKSDDQE